MSRIVAQRTVRIGQINSLNRSGVDEKYVTR